MDVHNGGRNVYVINDRNNDNGDHNDTSDVNNKKLMVIKIVALMIAVHNND